MGAGLKKYGFAVAILALLAVLTVAALFRGALTTKRGGETAAASSAQGGPPKGSARRGGERELTRVQAAPATERTFSDAIAALGTAQARESVTITSKVTDVIRAIRFESGDRVSKGQVLVELANVEQQADLDEAKAQLEVEKRSYDRFKELLDKGFAPRARYEAALASYDRAQARVEALEARIGDRTIRAPFAGIMGLRTASPGALARPGDPIATLDDTSLIKLDFDVPETQMARLKPGVSITARTAAFPDEVFSGRIDDIDSRVNTATRTVRIRALLPNPTGRLRPGMLMNVEIKSNPRKALAVPELAVLEGLEGASVFVVVQKDGVSIAQTARVTVGQRSGGYAEIISGVQPGAMVVFEGVQRVRPNQPVAVIDPAAPQKPGPAAAAPTPSRS
jgi:membrane fusion protein (multidrug efflux system)